MNLQAARRGDIEFNPWLVAVVVSLATFMEVLDTTITNVSLSHIAGSLSASQEESTWVLTSYLVSNGIILPLSGWLSGLMGRKRFFMLCIAGFTIASLMCGVAESLPMLIAFRLLQGLAGGGLQPMQQAIIMDSFPPERRGAVFGITGITMIVAPIMGPTLGGWITDNFSWRWVFYINIPVGIFALMMVYLMVRDPDHAKKQKAGKIDYIGLGLITLGLGALQIVLDKGQQEDWLSSSFITTFLITATAAIGSAILWLSTRKDPIVDLTLFKDRSFAIGAVLIFITGFILYSSSAVLPIMLQSQFGYDATMAGLVLSPGAIAVLFLMPISGQLVSRLPARYLAMFGLTVTALGCYLNAIHINPDMSYNTFVWLRAVQMLGIPFLFIPVSTMAFMNVPKEKSSKASSLFSLMRNLGGSVGIALVITHVTRLGQTNQGQMTGRLIPGNPVYENAVDTITASGVAHGLPQAAAHSNAIATIYHELLSQAAILSYSQTFGLFAAIAAFAVIMAFFLPMNNPRAKADPAASAH